MLPLISVDPQYTATASASGVPSFDHIFVIVMENHSFSQVIGHAPYIDSLAAQYGLATNYHAVAHPSLPNYLALSGASTFGVKSDCTGCFQNQPNIAADRISPSGRTWKAYQETMPSACFVGNSGRYVQKHDPFIYYNDIRTVPAQCANVVPYTRLAGDLGSASTTPNYSFITPNLCNDMHDCSIATGDSWLKTNVPMILNSSAYKSQNSVLFILFDEDNGSEGNRVVNLVISKSTPAGFRSNVAYTHYSLLKTIEQAWGLAPLTANDGNASAMTEFFGGLPPPPVTVVNQTNATATAATTSVTVAIPPTTTGNTLVAVASLFTGTSKSLATINDSSGATWSIAEKVASATGGSNGRVEIWWREKVAGGVTSVTLSQPSGQTAITRWAMKVLELKGVASAAALDVSSTAANAAVSTLKTGLAGPVGAAGEFVLGAVATSGTTSALTLAQGSSTPTSGWVALTDVGTGTSSTDVMGRTAYFGSTTTGGQYQAAWSTSAAKSGGAAVAVFKAGP